jgi:hypothetical protein
VIAPVTTPHLDACLPERRTAVAQLRLVSSREAPAEASTTSQRLVTVRAASQRLMELLVELERRAETGDLDFEAVVYELSVEEKGQLRQTLELEAERDESLRVQSEASRRVAAGQMTESEVENIRGIATQMSEAVALNRKVYEAYKHCRQHLAEIRDRRLTEYASVWSEYLTHLDAVIPHTTAEAVRQIWAELQRDLWPPEVSPTEDGLLMVWDRGPHHLEIEVIPETYAWLYRNRGDESFQAQEGVPLKRMPTTLRAVLRKTKRG